MHRVISVAFAVGMVATGCGKKSRDGLPPATEWQASSETAPSTLSSDAPRFGPPGMARRPGSPANDPHAGLGISGDPSDPHAGLDISGGPDDPHAGLDMSNPHLGGGTDVNQLGLAAPDPDRKIDPSQRVAGALTIAPRIKDSAKPGTAVFLLVKRVGPDGAPSGPTLAVDKLIWSKDGVPFELGEAQAMVAGTELRGDVVVMARYDQDSDALTREPGDITGQVRVTIPADNVKLQLDTVLP